MRLARLFLAFSLSTLATTAAATENVTLQLKWLPQAQFAGYYAAHDQGYFAAEGLDVVILPGGPRVAAVKAVRDGRADVTVEWLGAAMAAREKGTPLVNVAQVFKRSGMLLTCRRDARIAAPADLRGHVVGVWFQGNEFPFLSWMNRLGIPTAGGKDGVSVLMQDYTVAPLVDRTASCISTMSYNEYWSAVDAGFRPEDLTVFAYEDQGVGVLEDGLYVLERRLADAAFRDRMARFVRASVRGWRFARDNGPATVDALMRLGGIEAATRPHQERMLGEVLKLLSPEPDRIGRIEPADFDRSVQVLLAKGSRPVIKAPPDGGWTHQVWDLARPADGS